VSVVLRFVIAPLVLVGFVAVGVQISRQSRTAPRTKLGIVLQRVARAVHVYIGLVAIGFVIVLVIGLARLIL
jgi:hypothetical protein